MKKEEILARYEVLYLAGAIAPAEEALEALIDWLERRRSGLSEEDHALLMAAGSVLYQKVAEVRRSARRSLHREALVWDI